MDLTVFVYDHPHYKSVRYIETLALTEWRDRMVVVGAPWEKLNIPTAFPTTVKHVRQHPREVCERLGIPYFSCAHNDYEGGELGVIGGARVLSKRLIDRFSVGIVNLHPGLIPQNRGLSNLVRAVRDNLPQAVTAHFIDERIDAGRVLHSWSVPVERDDAIMDVGEKLMDMQIIMLESALALASAKYPTTHAVPDEGYEPPVPLAEEMKIIAGKWKDYAKHWSQA